LRAELEAARGEADAAEMARLVRELARQDANCDQLNVFLEQARRLGEEERGRAFVMSETMDKMREENRDLFRNLNNARAQVQEERRLMGVLRDEMGGVQKMLDDCRDELASSRDRGVMLAERSRRAKLALEDTLVPAEPRGCRFMRMHVFTCRLYLYTHHTHISCMWVCLHSNMHHVYG
jgi:hypothetical protein